MAKNTSSTDSHISKRRKISKIISLLKKIGYSFLLVSCLSFIVASLTSYNKIAVSVSTITIIVACIILPAPIVLGYGVKAAQREDLKFKDN
jgi:hypothetical protein